LRGFKICVTRALRFATEAWEISITWHLPAVTLILAAMCNICYQFFGLGDTDLLGMCSFWLLLFSWFVLHFLLEQKSVTFGLRLGLTVVGDAVTLFFSK
jgi:hypothetical protein